MVHPGIKSKQLTVQHMGQPCKGMPEVCIQIRESPNDILPANASLYMGVIANINIIIKIYKIIARHLPVNHKRPHYQRYADQKL